MLRLTTPLNNKVYVGKESVCDGKRGDGRKCFSELHTSINFNVYSVNKSDKF